MRMVQIGLIIAFCVIACALTSFICACFYRTYRRTHKHTGDRAPLLAGEEEGYGATAHNITPSYDETMTRARIYRPTPFTQADTSLAREGDGSRRVSRPPRYEDLYGGSAPPFDHLMPSFLTRDQV